MQYDSSCQCQEWKPSGEGQTLPKLHDVCRTCQHSLEAHAMLVKDLDDDVIDRILLIVYDMDNIHVQMKNEREDQDLRKTYGFLFNFLRKNMLQPKLPSLAGDKLGTPPFEKVSIAKVTLIRKLLLRNKNIAPMQPFSCDLLCMKNASCKY